MVTLQPNTKVRYKASPKIAGWVVGVEEGNARVFIEGSLKLIPISELEPAPRVAELSPEQFKAALTLRRLEHPLTEQLLSYRASKTQLYYNQFIPVKKILESPEQRLLIADEVGTGKTIEAGLVWAELEARASQGLENVWVICPKALVGKWQEEMLQRFDLRLELLTPEGLRQALVALDRDGVLPSRFAKSVVNLELVRAEEHVARLGQSPVAWDLVIFDEAHHLRNPETLSYALARFICERSKAAAFLTATPLQTGLEDIVHLMEALGVDVAADPHLLAEQIQWDMQLNDGIRLMKLRPPGWEQELYRLLDRLEREGGMERPGWRRLRELSTRSDLNDLRQRTTVIQAARDIQVLSPFMTRTLRSEIDVRRPVREAITRVVQFNPAEEKFYREVYEICLERARASGAPPGFVTQMPERRTASCVPAVAAEILKYASENEDEDHQARFAQKEVKALASLASEVMGTPDSKYDALIQMLDHLFGNIKADRVMIFSTFRGTLRYLCDQLKEKGYSLEMMHGDTPPKDEDARKGKKSRERISREFRAGAFQILLASEVAGEGLDFEHCHVVINYDLPWNPMRIEQRIGRCDRLGQQSEKVYVGNLASTGTIEARILSRLYERLHIFERALGDMELVLGPEIAEFEREVFTLDLSVKQQESRLDRVAEAIVKIEQQRQDVTNSSELFIASRQLIESEQQDIKDAESRFLSPLEIGEFVAATLEKHFSGSVKQLAGGVYEIANSKDIREAMRSLQRAYPSSHYARMETQRFSKRLDEGRIKVTFSGEPRQAEYVHVRHPLVLLARRLSREPLPEIPYCRGVSDKTNVPKMFIWAIGSLEGYTNRAELMTAVIDCATKEVRATTVEESQGIIRSLLPVSGDVPTISNIDDLLDIGEKTLLLQFDSAMDSFKERNMLLIGKAKHAVNSYADRKLKWLRHQLSRNDLKENIQNLYRGWSQRLETETQSKLEEIDQKGSVKSSLQVVGMVLVLPKI